MSDIISRPVLLVLALTTIFMFGYSATLGGDIVIYLSGIGDYASYLLSILPAAVFVILYLVVAIALVIAIFVALAIPTIATHYATRKGKKSRQALPVFVALTTFAILVVLFGEIEILGFSARGPLALWLESATFDALRPLVAILGYDLQSPRDLDLRSPWPALDSEIWDYVVSPLFLTAVVYAAWDSKKPEAVTPGAYDEEFEDGPRPVRLSDVQPDKTRLIPLATVAIFVFIASLFAAGGLKARLDSERRAAVQLHFADGDAIVEARPLFSTDKGIIVVETDRVVFYPWSEIEAIERPRPNVSTSIDETPANTNIDPS